MLNVFITVDTEFWPRSPAPRPSGLADDFRRDIHGATPEGDFGVPYQMDVLDAHGLKAVFLVEALSPDAIGLDYLREIVALVRGRGHEVQLHLHTEWLAWMPEPVLPGRTGLHLKDFTEDEQTILLERGLANLRACGVENPCAFRAGNYGANVDTLRALARHGIAFDTSHNAYYLGTQCGLHTPGPLLQPGRLEGVWEFPITCFRDWPGHRRHAQLCACSSRELEGALLQAWRRGWYAFVLVSHSFELINRRWNSDAPPAPDRAVIRRFERLCRFLEAHRDKFQTATFGGLDPASIPIVDEAVPLRSNVYRTARRFAEQLARRAR